MGTPVHAIEHLLGIGKRVWKREGSQRISQEGHESHEPRLFILRSNIHQIDMRGVTLAINDTLTSIFLNLSPASGGNNRLLDSASVDRSSATDDVHLRDQSIGILLELNRKVSTFEEEHTLRLGIHFIPRRAI